MPALAAQRLKIRQHTRPDEMTLLHTLIAAADIPKAVRNRITAQATTLTQNIRNDTKPGLMEVFLAEYGLSTDEGVALMCLAEALLRVPDAPTIDELIEDKIAASPWGTHLGNSSSSLVNASTWALMLSGKVLAERKGHSVADTLTAAIKRLGEPIIRLAVKQAVKEMGHQFVLGRTIPEALERGHIWQKAGYTFSYDMLGESALTQSDADKFFDAYRDAISVLSHHATATAIADNPGISIKLSALHPRYEMSQKKRVIRELAPKVLQLAIMARSAGMGLNIDAEEADRLDLSLDIIQAVLSAPELAGWDGFGVVVQAYGKRAGTVIDWLYMLAENLDRNVMVRLVKGAYWDSEIKIAQVDGVSDFPVFSRKDATDVSYICCAKKLLEYSDRIYPQFATHNAHTVAAILELADDGQRFEFQRLHGMGEALYRTVMARNRTSCRIYAPVGTHQDLLAYLVRRLLENGANSSFVNQIVDKSVPAEAIAADPFDAFTAGASWHRSVVAPSDLFKPQRTNSQGWDLRNQCDLDRFDAARAAFRHCVWKAGPIIAGHLRSTKPEPVLNPANRDDVIATVTHATPHDVETALTAARSWSDTSAGARAPILEHAATLYQENAGEIFAALTREAGKTQTDAVSELREAVDFLRYYAAQAQPIQNLPPRGLITCISPWNFPLAIFTGQIAAALAVGNGVLAKPADPTPIIAAIAVRLLHQAGVPKDVLQLLPGPGNTIGTLLTSDPRIDGICFTGSTGVAHIINRKMAHSIAPDAPFVAETGGLNAMIVDSTALPEQAVRDIVASAFQSAGQRCSALRLLYLQKDIADRFLTMLFGAMDELKIAAPWRFATDIGPVITKTAQTEITQYIDVAQADGRLLKKVDPPAMGLFVPLAVIRVGGIADLEQEVFGPVLHVATFESGDIDNIVNDINRSGYGLTFGLHSRIDGRVEQITSRINVGNIYINRNQIGAVVGSQPFGGEGLSGTGPKAGGPHYLPGFTHAALVGHEPVQTPVAEPGIVQSALAALPHPQRQIIATADMPGPTGESNRLHSVPRGKILCLGPTIDDAKEQMQIAQGAGCSALAVVPGWPDDAGIAGYLKRDALAHLKDFDAVALWSDRPDLTMARRALAQRNGPILALIATRNMRPQCLLERHICIDTTAAGGNAKLLAEQ